MGCSASCPANFVTQNRDPSSSSHCNPQLLSPAASSSDPFVNPVPRTLSVAAPLIYHPPVRKGDSNHFVSLTSTTYGSLTLPNPSFNGRDFNDRAVQGKRANDLGGSEDPLSPVSVINTWELMKGLDEDEFSFQMVESPKEPCKGEMFVVQPKSKPLWKYLSEESLLAKMESNVASSYRKALLGRQQGCQKYKCDTKLEKIEFSECKKNSPLVSLDRKDSCHLLGSQDRIVLYYTSLRGIRKTYEDCYMVRVILRGYRVCVDERDISMDRSYRDELQDALGGKRGVSLPQVFVKGKHIGSVEEIKQLNESGEFAKILDGFSVADSSLVCNICGDVRFVPCLNCHGSRKVYDEEEGELRRCLECNENGLIRCSLCCP